MKAEKEICQIRGRAFEGRENSLCQFMEPQMYVPGKKGEGIQKRLTWEGQWGWFIRSRECQGRAGPCGFFSLGWLLWASYIAVVEQRGRGSPHWCDVFVVLRNPPVCVQTQAAQLILELLCCGEHYLSLLWMLPLRNCLPLISTHRN